MRRIRHKTRAVLPGLTSKKVQILTLRTHLTPFPPREAQRFGTKLVLIQPDDKAQSGSGVPEKVSRFAQENGGEVIGWEVTIGYEALSY